MAFRGSETLITQAPPGSSNKLNRPAFRKAMRGADRALACGGIKGVHVGSFPHDAPPAAITARNPMGTDGFAFVEFAIPNLCNCIGCSGLWVLPKWRGIAARRSPSIARTPRVLQPSTAPAPLPWASGNGHTRGHSRGRDPAAGASIVDTKCHLNLRRDGGLSNRGRDVLRRTHTRGVFFR